MTQNDDELRDYAGAVYAAFPDFTVTPANAFGRDNRAVVEWTLTGTYSGSRTLPPGTGQQVDVRVASVLELADDGLIQRDSEYWDFATVLTQLGEMPESGCVRDASIVADCQCPARRFVIAWHRSQRGGNAVAGVKCWGYP